MDLFIVRHAIAEDAALGQADASRELTRDGTRKLRGVVRGLRTLGWRFDRLLTSPWLRAAQTADLLAPLAGGEPVATELLARAPSVELLALIAEHNAPAAVVGHEPWLGELIAWLAWGDPRRGESIVMKKAGVAWLEGTAVPGGMQLRALVPPSVLRAISR